MARGDVVSDIQSKTAGSDLDFQPAGSDEYMITEVGSDQRTGSTPNKTPDVNVILYDGAIESLIRYDGERWDAPLKLFINNTNYLRITNTSGSTAVLSYCGIQTK
jgi:hypothetical protein